MPYKDKDGVNRKGKGRVMAVDGKRVELFPSSVLAGVLQRSLKTIYVWEEKYNFPQAMWRIDDDKVTNRWYSRRQILAIRKLYEGFHCLKGGYRTHLKDFVKAVRLIFFIIDRTQDECVTSAPQTEETTTQVVLSAPNAKPL